MQRNTQPSEDHVVPIDHARFHAAPRDIGGRAWLRVSCAARLSVRRDKACGEQLGSARARSGRCRLSRTFSVQTPRGHERPDRRKSSGRFVLSLHLHDPRFNGRGAPRQRQLFNNLDCQCAGLRSTPARRLLSACSSSAVARQKCGRGVQRQHVRVPLSKTGFEFRRPHHLHRSAHCVRRTPSCAPRASR